MRVIVLGYVVRGPLGGLTWHHVQYLMGLAQLGHDVYFLEDSDDFESCYDPGTHEMTTDPTFGLKYAERVFARTGFGERWAYYDAHTRTWHGPCGSRALELCSSADACINVSGVNPIRDWLASVPLRMLIDTDPAFTQIRHLTDAAAMGEARKHNAFFTFAENYGLPECTVPDDGLAWRPTRQPIALDAWSVRNTPSNAAFSTIMQWESYPARRYAGRDFGMKSASFAPYVDLPKRVNAVLEIAIGGASAPRERLAQHGWLVRDSYDVSADPWIYRDFIARSKAEFSVAKQGYVATVSGWFSERSAAYLASGKPVVTQETGFSRRLGSGEGLFAFSSPDEAADAIDAVCNDYARQSAAARRIAEDHFDASDVLAALLRDAQQPISSGG